MLLLTLAEVSRTYLAGHAGEILQKGRVILGWVALWKPIEVLLYEWWPLAQQRVEFSRIAAAEVDVRTSASVKDANAAT